MTAGGGGSAVAGGPALHIPVLGSPALDFLNVKDGGDPQHFRSGNRDTGLAIRSKKLSKFFTKILDSDMHVFEPYDLYEKYMDPKWGERIPRGTPRTSQ